MLCPLHWLSDISPRMAFPLTDREIFLKVSKDSFKNVIWYGGLVVVIALVGKGLWWWVGIVLWGAWTLLLVASILQTLIVAILGIITVPLSVSERLKGREVDGNGQLYLAAGQVIQLIEMGVYVSYFYWLYTVFFR